MCKHTIKHDPFNESNCLGRSDGAMCINGRSSPGLCLPAANIMLIVSLVNLQRTSMHSIQGESRFMLQKIGLAIRRVGFSFYHY